MSKTFQPDSLHPYIMDARLKKATGSGGIGNIPIASADTVGGIKIGGSTNPITITGSGNASVRKATSELLGVVKAGDGVSIDADGAINAGNILTTTEYKTGEKYLDNDVYAKVFILSETFVSSGSKYTLQQSVGNYYSKITDGIMLCKSPTEDGADHGNCYINFEDNNLYFKPNGNWSNLTSCTVIVKYTK